MGPRLFRKANPGAQQAGEPRATGLRALWLIDLKSWVLTISELLYFLGALADETCKTRENSNFLKKGKIVISIKTRNFSRSRMTKRISPL